jgi:hypothetical protein
MAGYLALCYIGSATTAALEPSRDARKMFKDAKRNEQHAGGGLEGWRWFVHCAVWAVVAWAFTMALGAWVQPISRRLCNAAYACWIAAMALTTLLFSAVAEVLAELVGGGRAAATPLLTGLSRHQLAVFLAANLLTGGINLSLDTLAMPDSVAMAVLAAYMAAWCGVPLLVSWCRETLENKGDVKPGVAEIQVRAKQL